MNMPLQTLKNPPIFKLLVRTHAETSALHVGKHAK